MCAALAVIRYRIVCAWCSLVMDRGTPNAPTSHTICAACALVFV